MLSYPRNSLDLSDLIVVMIYFLLILAIGIYASIISRRDTVQGYFLAGRNMAWYLVGASLFVSNIGSEHFIGLAGSGASGGIGVGAWELNALMLLQLLGWIFIPVYISSGVNTMPEYLGRRFGGRRLRIYLASLSLLLYCLTKISYTSGCLVTTLSILYECNENRALDLFLHLKHNFAVNLYSGALFIEQSIGWSLYPSIILLVGLTGLLTVTGGLTVVMYTDSLQAALMVGGAIYLTVQGFVTVGGYYEMKERYMMTSPNLTQVLMTYNVSVDASSECVPHPRSDSFVMLKGVSDDEMPWLGFLLGQTPSSLWYWCTDQVIVQRALAAKSLSHAQGGTLMAGVIKILPMFIMVMPGMIARVLFTDDLVCVPGDHCMKLCGSEAGCTNLAYPTLVLRVMPSGARGLMMAVMVAALMSDLDSIFNSSSTIFTLDIWKRVRRNASRKELMIVGRLFILLLVLISIMWVPIIQHFQGGQLFFYIQEVTNYISPPIAAIFLIGVLWPGCTEKGAFYGGLCGSLLGLARLIVIFLYAKPICGEEDKRPSFLKDLHYMYYSALLFLVTLVVAIFVSFFTTKPSPENVSRLTYWTRYDSPPAMSDEMENLNMNEICKTKKESIPIGSDVNSIETDVKSPGCDFKSLARRFGYFVCGLNQHERESELEMTSLPSLKQDPLARKFLTAGLAAILACGTSLYIFWSV